MKIIFRIGFAGLLAALAASAAGGQATPDTGFRQIVAVSENGAVFLDFGASTSSPDFGVQTKPIVVESPRHGRLDLDGFTATYTPEASFTGRDRVALTDGAVIWALELVVLPRVLPLAGRFYNQNETAGLYDNDARAFLLCEELVSSEEPLRCEWLPVEDAGVETTWVPLAWQLENEGLEVPALFDIETGELRILAPAGSSLVVQQVLSLPDAAGGLPVRGDWNHSGGRDLAVVFADGRVLSHNGVKWGVWPTEVEVPESDGLAWPILFQREGERDALALVHPKYGDLTWLSLASGGETFSGTERSMGGTRFLRPLAWVMAPSPSAVESSGIFFLEKGPEGLQLVPGKYRGLKPQTIPVKFPDDPPGP